MWPGQITSQFTSDMRQTPGDANVVTDLLPRLPAGDAVHSASSSPLSTSFPRSYATVAAVNLVSELNLQKMASDQFRTRAQFQHLREDSSLSLALRPVPESVPPVRILGSSDPRPNLKLAS